MTQAQFDELLQKLESFKRNLEDYECDKEEYLDAIIDDFNAQEEQFLSNALTLEDWFNEWREKQEFSDGAYRDIMLPDIDEDDQEYPDDYDSCDNEDFRIHTALLDELEAFLEI